MKLIIRKFGIHMLIGFIVVLLYFFRFIYPEPPTSDPNALRAALPTTFADPETVPDIIEISDEWEISFVYEGHIKSQYDYPTQQQYGGDWGADSVTVTTSSDHINTVNNIEIIKPVNNKLPCNDNISIYSLNYNGEFSYENKSYEENDQGIHYKYQDSYSIQISKEKAIEYYSKILQILNAQNGIPEESTYEPYHANEDGIMITEYKPFNLVGDSHVFVEITEQQYNDLCSVFEDVRQRTDKYNWEKVNETLTTNAPQAQNGMIEIPPLP